MISTVVQCILFVLTVYCFLALCNRRSWQLLSQIPGPRRLPLIGSAYVLFGVKCSTFLDCMMNLTRTHGTTWCIWFGLKPIVHVGDAEQAKIILASPAALDKASLYRFTRFGVLFAGPAHQWRPLRKQIQPLFNMSILKSYIPLFEEKSNMMIRNLAANVDRVECFNIYSFIARCTLDMVCATTFETDMRFQFQEDSSCTYLHSVEKALEMTVERFLNPPLHLDWIYRWSSTYRKEDKALQEIYRPAKDILLLPSKSKFIVDYLSALKRNGHDEKRMIQTEVAGFIYAGHETSAITISNTLLLLAMHPDVQEQVAAEIRQHCGALGEDIRYETLQELVFLEMVLKESLRLLPIAPFVGRKTTQDIAMGKYILPAGADVFINIYSIHHNPTYWGEDADQFRPERFATTTYDRATYLPFSAGMRNCLGAQYAMISVKVLLIKILTFYRLATDLKPNDLSMKFSLTMRNTDGHMVRLTRR